MRSLLSLAETYYCQFIVGGGHPDDIERLCVEQPSLAHELKRCQRLHATASRALGTTHRSLPTGDARRYTTVGELGRGGMGQVDEALDERLLRHIAVKRPLAPDAQGVLGEFLRERRAQRLVAEARLLASLRHPGIPPVHDIGEDSDGTLYFTMSVVRGTHFGLLIEDLHTRTPKWSLVRALDAVERACRTLAFAHDCGVVHRDVKPTNLMVGTEGQVHVLDWGVAIERAVAKLERFAATEGQDFEWLPSSEVVGTLAYMAPEHAAGAGAPDDPRLDVYGVGALLYHLISGAPPYSEVNELDGHALLEHVGKRHGPAPLSERAATAPQDLVAIVERAMARDLHVRYATMDALADDLRAFLELRPVAAARAGATYGLRVWTKRNRGAALALLLTVAAAAMAAVTVLRTLAHVEKDLERARSLQELATIAAQTSAHEAHERAVDGMLPADCWRLDVLRERHRALGPATPGLTPGIRAWITDTEALLRHRPLHEAALARLRALDTAGGTERAAQMGFLSTELVRARDEQAQAFAELRRSPEVPERVAAATRSSERLERVLLELENTRKWHFPAPDTQWRHDTLAALLVAMDELAILRELECERVVYADSVRERSLDCPAARDLWDAACAEIQDPGRCPVYAGLVLSPQLGLLPLGRDPGSGLHEFAHLASGVPAERDPTTSTIALREESGLVLILLPGDAAAAIEPFFISKFEVTQAQWLRWTRKNPSLLHPDNLELVQRVTLLHPVGRLSFSSADHELGRLGLVIPEYEEWRYAALAGAKTEYCTGADPASLLGHANVADRATLRDWPQSVLAYSDYDDGWSTTAPVATFAPNRFGLYDVHGNASEFTRRSADASVSGTSGGGALYSFREAGVSWRRPDHMDLAWTTFGVRPGMRIEVPDATSR